MIDSGFTLFDTALGRCAIAWSDRGVVGLQLPEKTEDAVRARMQRRFPELREESPPAHVQQAIDGVVSLMRGEPADLSAVKLDLERVPDFNRRVYEIARAIPPGSTLTYGEIAARIGEPDARSVGQAMGQNPFPPVVPCHRVLAAGGKTGGFSASGGVKTKLRLLTIEGALAAETLPLFGFAAEKSAG